MGWLGCFLLGMYLWEGACVTLDEVFFHYLQHNLGAETS